MCGVQKFNHATCHSQGRGGQYSSKKSIHSGGKAGEAGHGHVNGILQEEGSHCKGGALERGLALT